LVTRHASEFESRARGVLGKDVLKRLRDAIQTERLAVELLLLQSGGRGIRLDEVEEARTLAGGRCRDG
jgi:hypothetical protein